MTTTITPTPSQPERGDNLVTVALACGHTTRLHCLSSVFDFPQEGAHCPTCGKHQPLANNR